MVAFLFAFGAEAYSAVMLCRLIGASTWTSAWVRFDVTGTTAGPRTLVYSDELPFAVGLVALVATVAKRNSRVTGEMIRKDRSQKGSGWGAG